jgi:cell wall-associated NlpC family hydrolase
VEAGQPSPNPTAHLAGDWEGTLVPEHALRVDLSRPARSRFTRFTRFTRRSRTHSPNRPTGFSRFRRSRLLVATCAIAGAATLGACSPNDIGQGNHAVNIATQYIGTPYVYGGAQPGGFDCSGLTQYVYGQLGKYLPRSAEQQYEYVQKIPQSWVQKGDLIFFGSPGAVYHVGIYVGNGMIEHAPTPGQVVSIIPIWTSQYYVGRVG